MPTEVKYHKVLERQIRKVFGKESEIPSEIFPLLDLISRTYIQYDDEKELLNNTMDVGMRELAESNNTLISQKIALEEAYQTLIETQNKLSEAEQIASLMHEVANKNDQLVASEEELKQNLEELQTTQDNLKNKQKALSAALAQNKAVTDALDSSAIVSITDLKGNIIKANKAFCDVSGYAEDELLGKNHNLVNSGFHPKSFWTDMWKTVAQGNTWRAEICNRAKDGSLYWVEAVINPIYNDLGKIHQYLAIRYLITQRKRAEQIIQEQNQALQNSLAEVTSLRQKSEEARQKTEQLLNDLKSSIEYAHRIQTAFLPKKESMETHFKEFMLHYVPKDIVSGDFYWFTTLPSQELILAVADCTGHGVPGAFMTVVGQNLLDQIVNKEHINSPAQILKELDKRLSSTIHNQHVENEGLYDGMDIAVIKWNPKKQSICFAGARRPLWLFNSEQGEITEYKAAMFPIGGGQQWEKKDFTEVHLELSSQSVVYLLTDGYADQFGMKRKFTTKKLKSLLTDIHKKSFEAQQLILQQTFLQWKGTEEQTDDILIIGIRI
ncbi:MAG: PAS domain S-box protein [Cytophagales bacterium]|nr:MAG: PAS domain S-box protein [Cytophagales bacterium]